MMLQDHPPIPQYTVRLFSDLANLSSSFATYLSSVFIACELWKLLIQLLVPPEPLPERTGEHLLVEDGDDYSAVEDPQVAILVRVLFESSEHMNSGFILENSAMATSLASAVTVSVFYSPLTASPVTMEGALPLVELLLTVLHFVIRAVSLSTAAEDKDGGGGASQVRSPRARLPLISRRARCLSQAERYRRAIAPLRSVCPALLMVFACSAQFQSDILQAMSASLGVGVGGRDGEGEGEGSVLFSSHRSLSDSCSRCLGKPTTYCFYVLQQAHVIISPGILFDLFPDAVTNVVLSKQSLFQISKIVAVGAANSASFASKRSYSSGPAAGMSADATAFSPRHALAKILLTAVVEPKPKLRLLKIVNGIMKVSASMKLTQKAKELILSENLMDALLKIRSISDEDVAKNNDSLSLAKLAAHIIEQENKM
jgi:hypothetical protein